MVEYAAGGRVARVRLSAPRQKALKKAFFNLDLFFKKRRLLITNLRTWRNLSLK